MKKRMIWAIAIIFVLVVGSGVYYATAKTGYVAKVGDTKITQQQLNNVLNKQYGSAALETLIQDQVITLEAEKQKVTASDAEVDAQYKKVETQYGGADALESALESNNMSKSDFKANLKTYVLASKMIEKDLDTSDETLKAYLKENQSTFDTAAQVKASHILVEKKATATKIKKELDAGGDFAKLAKKYSTDTATKSKGGDLGYFTKSEMVEEFATQAFSMKKGDISDPIKTDYGYHIIKVTGKVDAKTAKYEDVKDKVKEAYIEAQISAQYSSWLTEKMADYDITNTLSK